MNKAESMGYGTFDGVPGKPLPKGNPGNPGAVEVATDIANANREHAERLQFMADVNEAYAMDAKFDAKAKKAAIGEKLTSTDNHQLNENARIAVYGSNGRTAGITDPVSGEPITEPVKGRIAEILEDDRIIKSSTERQAKADKYEKDLLGIVNRGYELSQAKLIMDLREGDEAQKIEYISKQMHEGLTAAQAGAKANKLYRFKDKKRMKMIKEDGVLTMVDYLVAVRNRNQASHVAEEPETPEEDDADTAIIPPVADPTPRGLRARARNIMALAAVRMQNGMQNVREFFTDDDESTRRKRRTGAVAGAVVLAGIAYLGLKGLDLDSDHAKHVAEHTPKHPNPVEPAHHSVHMHKGDTIWDESKASLVQKGNSAPTNAEIMARTQKNLALNHMTWEQARHLAETADVDILD